MQRAILLAAISLLLAFPAATSAGRIDQQQARAKPIICKVFKEHCADALAVSWCESKWYIWAQNGQYKGLFQMGDWERRTFGHGPGAWAQTRAAYKYFVQSGRDWSPWACKWAAGY
jgi:hypothetical protein